MFVDYQKRVVEDYRRKVKEHSISLRLIHPTPANLRAECVFVFKKGVRTKDENTLKSFFELSGGQVTYLKAIESYDIDKFRPLVNFLKQKTGTPDYKIIELMAWLIDFMPRPYDDQISYEEEYSVVQNIKEEIKGEEVEKEEIKVVSGDKANSNPVIVAETDEPTGEPTPSMQLYSTASQVSPTAAVPPAKSPARANTQKMAIGGVILLVVLAIAAYINWGRSSKPEYCMYWAENHYQQVSCNQKMPGVLVIAMDSVKLKNFKKITTPDTISSKAIGYVWYSKNDNNLEFFTGDGMHPVHIDLRLRPITQYIISKYIEPASPSK